MLLKPVLIKGVTLLFDLLLDEVMKEVGDERMAKEIQESLLVEDEDR